MVSNREMWHKVLQDVCISFKMAQPGCNEINALDVLLRTEGQDDVLRFPWIVLKQDGTWHVWPFFADLPRKDMESAEAVFRVFHDAVGNILSIRALKMRSGSTDIFNLYVKTYAKDRGLLGSIDSFQQNLILNQPKADPRADYLRDQDVNTGWNASDPTGPTSGVLSDLRNKIAQDGYILDTPENTYDECNHVPCDECDQEVGDTWLDRFLNKLEQGAGTPSEDTYVPENDSYAANPADSERVTGEHGGVKLDGTKAKFGLVPPDAYLAVAEVMTAGALKYSANNWVGLELSRVLDAMERHINAFRMGEELAADSKQHHMAHAIANAMMAYHIVKNKPEQDDRLFKYLTPQTNAYDMYIELLERVAQDTTMAVAESDIKKFYSQD